MFKNYFEGIKNIATYPMISLLVFFIFFVGMAVWWIKANKKDLEEMSRLPLEDETENENLFSSK